MKRIYLLFLAIIFFVSGVLFFPPQTSLAQGAPQISISPATVTRSNGVISATVSGTFNSVAATDPIWSKSDVYSYAIQVTTSNVSSLNLNSFSSVSGSIPETCSRTSTTFTCTFSGLGYGTYFFGAYLGTTTPGPETVSASESFTTDGPITPAAGSPDISNLAYPVNNGTAVVTGNFNAAAVSDLQSSNNLELLYWSVVQTPDLSGDIISAIDLSTVNSVPVNIGTGGPSTTIPFTATIPNLTAGSYAFVLLNGASGFSGAKYFSRFIDFTVSPTVQSSEQFVSATPTGSTTLDTSVDVKINVFNSPSPSTAYIQLGLATAPTGSNIATCNPVSGLLSQAITLAATVGTSPVLAEYNFAPPTYAFTQGAYCAGIKFATVDPTGLTQGGYTNVTYFNNIFPLLGATVPANLTLNSAANPNGCVTGNGNNGYCLLVPLPGIGDATGYVNVSGTDANGQSGLGNYINGIIRLVIGLIGVLSVLMIVIGGVEYMTTVNMGEKEGARSRIMGAIYGLILALASYMLLYTINPDLVNLTINVPGVQLGYSNTPYPPGVIPTAGSGITTPNGTSPTVKSTNAGIDQYNSMMQTAAAATGLECTYGKAIMSVEDPSGNASISSPVGAIGLMQMMPATFQTYNTSGGSITDAQSNINAGFAFLAALQKNACNGSSSNPTDGCTTSNQIYVSAAYNGGPGINGPSADCGPSQTQWQCSINRGGLQQTYNYAYQVQTNYNALKASGGGC